MWTELKQLAAEATGRDMIRLFDAADDRAVDFAVRFDGMLFDYSKTHITQGARNALINLAQARGVAARRDAMFAGDVINFTENRPVLHVALRNIDGDPIMVNGRDVMPGVRETLTRMEQFASDVRAGRFAGAGGAITDVINIGIGGSHLGPEMGTKALRPYHDGPRCHFVSNVDGWHLHSTLEKCDPETTLFVIVSKTFIRGST